MTDHMAAPVERAVRGRVLSFHRQPEGAGDLDSCRYLGDGVVLVAGGRIVAVGTAAALLPGLPPGVPVDHHPRGLILPGFIDTHIHFPQTQVIASYGARLLDWLEKYTFVEEQRFADLGHAGRVAAFFVAELLRNGTTSAVVYGSVHPGSVDALFREASRCGMGLVAGKVMMDRNAPPALTDTARTGYDQSKDLIAHWHGRDRQRYAVTPRFAITSTPEQLEAAGTLLREHPGVLMQTHLAENAEEIAAVRRLFPEAVDYTDVYDRFGLLGPRSLFGHCLHLDGREQARLAESGSVAVFCPTSNLFIGSGLFDLDRLTARSGGDRAGAVRLGLATDVGGGTSYSLLATLGEAYKVLALQRQTLPALTAFDLITRRNADAMAAGGDLGRLEAGYWADMVVLDSAATPAMAHRMETVDGLEEELFVLMTLGDDRAVSATYVQGRRVK